MRSINSRVTYLLTYLLRDVPSIRFVFEFVPEQRFDDYCNKLSMAVICIGLTSSLSGSYAFLLRYIRGHRVHTMS